MLSRELRNPVIRALFSAGVLLCLAAGPVPAAAPAKSYQVAYRLTETQHILVRARVNGKGPFHFIVDTGAPAVYLAPAAAKRANLTLGKNGWAVLDRLELEGGPVLEKVESRVEEPPQLTGMNAMGLAGARLDGIFGYSLLSRFRIEIDLSRPSMRWTPVPYQPQPLQSLQDLSGGKLPAPGPNAGALQALAGLASLLFPRQVETAPVPRGFLGFEVTEEAGGLRVACVLESSPAVTAGLRKGDRLLQVVPPGAAAVPVKKTAELMKAVEPVLADQELILEIERAGQPLRLSVRTGKGAF